MLMFNVQLYKDVCENEESNTNKLKQILVRSLKFTSATKLKNKTPMKHKTEKKNNLGNSILLAITGKALCGFLENTKQREKWV